MKQTTYHSSLPLLIRNFLLFLFIGGTLWSLLFSNMLVFLPFLEPLYYHIYYTPFQNNLIAYYSYLPFVILSGIWTFGFRNVRVTVSEDGICFRRFGHVFAVYPLDSDIQLSEKIRLDSDISIRRRMFLFISGKRSKKLPCYCMSNQSILSILRDLEEWKKDLADRQSVQKR